MSHLPPAPSTTEGMLEELVGCGSRMPVTTHERSRRSIVFWTACRVDKIVKLQKRAIRVICNKPYRYHTEPLFKAENILNIHDLYKIQIALFVYDIKNNNIPLSFNNFLNSEFVCRYNTRHQHLLHQERPRTKFSSKLPRHMFVSVWNNLISNIKPYTSKSNLKTLLTKYLLNLYSANIKCSNLNCIQCNA